MRVGSLFSGIGGIDIGFEQAGFSIAWAIEKDVATCKTYRANYPNVKLIENDIRNIDPKDLEKVDVITAGFPCQSFSIAGKQRGFSDPHGCGKSALLETSQFQNAIAHFELLRRTTFASHTTTKNSGTTPKV